ncbi:SNARE complex subunit Vam7 [Aspergillus sclerotialis]|uniref:SNARE complex subunit Vam7 n=1 Tax=Aspergillus sclerotialis TaxID=2070753 RepID=A0A3A2ZG09_9EURO|nr:SNARE complex subunit Vam7 [Aspergillus sclerotialis]
MISKRYSDFVSLHSALISQTAAPPPAPLPRKAWFSSTTSNAALRENRRIGLETYLRAINEDEDKRWRNSSAWRAFLNLPSSSSSSGPGSARFTESGVGIGKGGGRMFVDGDSAGDKAITDPTVWLDSYRDMKAHLHDARLHLTRRDQETTPQRQHESSAMAKSSLVRAGNGISALEAGLKEMTGGSNGGGRADGDGETGSISSRSKGGGGSGLGEGEIRRRKDLLVNARKEKDGLEDLLNAMTAKRRLDSAVASIQDKEALVGGGNRKASGARAGRVLGKETERTRELDNEGVLQLQRQTMEEQDLSVDELRKIVARQKELGIAINAELEIQNELLKLTDEDADRLQRKVDIGKKRVDKIS